MNADPGIMATFSLQMCLRAFSDLAAKTTSSYHSLSASRLVMQAHALRRKRNPSAALRLDAPWERVQREMCESALAALFHERNARLRMERAPMTLATCLLWPSPRSASDVTYHQASERLALLSRQCRRCSFITRAMR